MQKIGSQVGSQVDSQPTNQAFGEKLQILRKKIGISQKEMAQKIGVATSTYQRYEEGYLPKGDHLVKICKKLGCSLDWLLGLTEEQPNLAKNKMIATGTGISQVAGNNNISTINKVPADTKIEKNLHSSPFLLTSPETISSATTDYYLVPKVKARLNAGTGSLETEGQIVGKYAFRLDWIHTITTSPNSLVLMDVFGDSMEPEIKDGDTVMVDQSQTEIIVGKIYAVGFGEEIVIKQAYKEPNLLILKSINKEYDPIKLPGNEWKDSIRIIGRVVWWCREG